MEPLLYKQKEMKPSSYTSSSSSSSYQRELTNRTIIPSYLSSLRSVRKPLRKPMTKKPIAPLPPTPPKVYKFDSRQFKQVVRRLTSVPEFQQPTIAPRRLQDIAPPPLDISSTTSKLSLLSYDNNRTDTTVVVPPQYGGGNLPPASPMIGGFSLSPDMCNFLNETLDFARNSIQADTNTNSSKCLPVDFGTLSPLKFCLSPSFYNLIGETVPPLETCKQSMSFLSEYNSGGLLSPLGLGLLSPSSLSWCSSALLSPGTMSAMGQSPVL